MKRHNERCKDCKINVLQFLVKVYGSENILFNHDLNFPNKVDELNSSDNNSALEVIYSELQNSRGHHNFVRAKKLPRVDFLIKDKFILEFDESQHFTAMRLVALENYPEEIKLGYDRKKWKDLCKKINKKDNDPAFRDEQRAWYDTLRDFAPTYLGLSPTVRLYATDNIWCQLDISKNADIELFKSLIERQIA